MLRFPVCYRRFETTYRSIFKGQTVQENSVTSYQSTLLKIQEGRRSHLKAAEARNHASKMLWNVKQGHGGRARIFFHYEDCKRRWRSIKDTYKRLIREGKLSAETASSSRRCKWPLLNVLTFLNVVPGRKRTQVNADSMHYVNTEECDDDVNETETWDPPLLPASPSSSVTSVYSSQGSKKMKNNERIACSPNKHKARHQKVIYVTSSCEKKGDEIDLFYRSIALTVKRLPPHLIAEVKLQHLKTLTEMEPRVYHEEGREQQYFQHLTQEVKFSHMLPQKSLMRTVHISNTDREEESITSDI